MSFGIIEVISLLLGLSGFGVQHNPKAPTADAALQYAMPSPDVVVHFDATSVIPGNYKVLQRLPNQPQIKSSPELAKIARKVISEVEGARGLAKGATGIDLVTDVHDATVFVEILPRRDPNFVAVVHGRFSPATIDKIAKMSRGKVSRLAGGVVVEQGNDPAIGVTRDGVLIAGTPSLVRDRLDGSWQAPARAAGSTLGHAAEVIDGKPIYAVVLGMSQGARAEAVNKIGGKNFLTDLVKRHKVASMSVFHNGVGWTWIDSSRSGLDSMALMSEGFIELMRAGHIAPRGFAKLALGAIDSYRGSDRRLDDLIRRKADVMKIVESYTGDGNFAAKVDKDPRQLKLTVRATGKSLSEVVPAGLFIPLGAIGFLTTSRVDDKAPPARVSPPPPRKATPGLRRAN